MTLFSLYEQKLIRLTDDQGNIFTGIADTLPAEFCMHEYGLEEEAIQLGEYIIYKSQIAKVEILPTYEEAVATIPLGRYFPSDGNMHTNRKRREHHEAELL